MRTSALLAVLLLAAACATGNPEWRKDSYATTVELREAGDGRCSDPAPFQSIRACLLHDASYQVARNYRVVYKEPLDIYNSEQARLATDLMMATQMALDGYPEWWVWLYYHGVRLGAWWSWHYAH